VAEGNIFAAHAVDALLVYHIGLKELLGQNWCARPPHADRAASVLLAAARHHAHHCAPRAA
jgi:hypothetical protein